ncbi:hypothetical protein HK102_003193 [Quaeritorhiza haematococci]|nr:hypothetical protein HK102_003193 [Quaeritorhiza haematococci]
MCLSSLDTDESPIFHYLPAYPHQHSPSNHLNDSASLPNPPPQANSSSNTLPSAALAPASLGTKGSDVCDAQEGLNEITSIPVMQKTAPSPNLKSMSLSSLDTDESPIFHYFPHYPHPHPTSNLLDRSASLPDSQPQAISGSNTLSLAALAPATLWTKGSDVCNGEDGLNGVVPVPLVAEEDQRDLSCKVDNQTAEAAESVHTHYNPRPVDHELSRTIWIHGSGLGALHTTAPIRGDL